jgi:hypothetical protein
MDRRDFLRTGLGLGAAALLPSSAFAEEKKKTFDANAFVDSFPDAKEIPGIARVQRYRVEQANRVLVVLRQHHEIENPLPEDATEAESCQIDLLKAMDYLRKKPELKFKAPHNESTHYGDEERYINTYRDLTRQRLGWAIEDRKKLTNYEPTDEEFAKLLYDQKALRYRIGDMSTLARVGAAEILALRGHLQIRAGECGELRRKIEEEGNALVRDRMLFDGREDKVVEFAAETGDDVSYVVYGAAHDFQNNLKYWNMQEENKVKFASVVLTPNTAERCDRERRKQKPLPSPPPPPPPPAPPKKPMREFIDFF